ncbi:MAG: hypothetical protein ACE5FA_04565 [Dehalococcoidia bacterium]
MYVKRRWWLAMTLLTGNVVVVACTLWLSLSLPGDGQALERAALFLAMLAGCGYMALGVIRDFWIRLDALGVWQPSLVGWKRIQWNDVVAIKVGHGRIALRSDHDSIVINVGAFSHRDELIAALRQCLPPTAVSNLELR